MTKLYVAYGSNLHLGQMARRCPTAKVVGVGNLNGYQLTFRRVATIEPMDGAITPVGVWEIGKNDEQALDRYEGYPHLYRKEIVDVEMYDGSKVQAMVYIMNNGKPEMPSIGYYETIAQGYNDIGLELKYLTAALEDTNKRIRSAR